MIKWYGRVPEVKSYKQAMDFLAERKKRKICHETWIELRENNTVAVRYHATDVVTFTDKNAVLIKTDGWYTKTTKERISAFSPLRVSQRKGRWYVCKSYDWDNSIEWTGGRILFENGEIKQVQ